MNAKKKLVIGLLILVGGYLALAVAASLIVPKMIVDSERRLFGVRLAAVRVEQDQILLSQRIQDVTNRTLGKGGSKDEEVAALLADPDINRLALVYLGTDWAVQRSGFVGAASHLRREVKRQQEAHKKIEAQTIDLENQMAQRVKDLEQRRKSLNIQFSRLNRKGLDYQAKCDELDDIDRQLRLCRDRSDYHDLAYRRHLAHKEADKKFVEAHANAEAEIFRLASEYQDKTVGTLTRVLAEKMGELRVEANKPDRLRRLMSPFNIWPVNLICRMPLEGGTDGKPL